MGQRRVGSGRTDQEGRIGKDCSAVRGGCLSSESAGWSIASTYALEVIHAIMNTNARIDALQLMLTDLRTRNEPIRHKAAFRGCQPEFQALVSRLIEQLGGAGRKQRGREESRSAAPDGSKMRLQRCS